MARLTLLVSRLSPRPTASLDAGGFLVFRKTKPATGAAVPNLLRENNENRTTIPTTTTTKTTTTTFLQTSNLKHTNPFICTLN